MIKIEAFNNDQIDIDKFNDWIHFEWGSPDPLTIKLLDEQLPKPILAYGDNVLLGGLKFAYYRRTELEEKSLWINALYVKPESRRTGIAKALVNKAIDVVKISDYNELFVYTTYPALYQSIGWDVIDTINNNYTLKMSVD